MTRVKICGVKRPEDARMAVEEGADLLGLVFYPQSHRLVDQNQAREIADAAREAGDARIVGVFVDESVQEMNRLAQYCGLDLVQLSAGEPDEVIAQLDVPAIRVIHVERDMASEKLAARIQESPAELILLDTARAGSYGGTGETFDWSNLPELGRPVLLAGGLHAGNVAAAIMAVQPWGVDVSSGVETGREKDQAKIRDFLAAAK